MSDIYLQDINGKNHLLSLDDFIKQVKPQDVEAYKEIIKEFHDDMVNNMKKDGEMDTILLYEDKQPSTLEFYMNFLLFHADKLADVLCQKKLNVKYVRANAHFAINDVVFLNIIHEGDKAIIKGFAFCNNPEKEELYISTLCGTGGTAQIFKMIVKVMMEDTYKKPLSFVHLDSVENPKTINFYSKLGFRKTDKDSIDIIKDMFKSKAKTFDKYVKQGKSIVGGSMYLFSPDTRGERQLKKHKCHYVYTPKEWFDEIKKFKQQGKGIKEFLRTQRKEKLEGAGLGSFFRGIFNYVIDPMGTLSIPYQITKLAIRNMDTIKDWLHPYLTGFTNAGKKVIEQYGDVEIHGMYIQRTPVKDTIMALVDLITLGKFDELKKEAGFDKMFHLGLVAQLPNGIGVLMEKNDRVELFVNKPPKPLTEYYRIPQEDLRILGSEPLTINLLLKNALECMGERAFFDYDAFYNNCQVFVTKLLECSGIDIYKSREFVFQNVEEVARRLPDGEKKLMNGITTLGSIFSNLTGQGRPQRKKKLLTM